jgi:hypothetical protein
MVTLAGVFDNWKWCVHTEGLSGDENPSDTDGDSHDDQDSDDAHSDTDGNAGDDQGSDDDGYSGDRMSGLWMTRRRSMLVGSVFGIEVDVKT